ncbi:class I SAM-dependent methyltransferase [Nocardioides sp. zg-1228]|uniref:class I SAM-dependent methyltransferase n=1 Tax=Nocardioides sp. zg-1228 TaxID=2763008 RepID=UPI0016425190|nr:class I SAM-dependent methyltransferase [Nocardioides sp. zg-1228]MBC2933274.1 class I SAM-dependent methyltransferase [Nocardioides sp. zg-1228]QSF56562.1 class I SAM-dependent methyltransferase [Nocardioides sp. zg-1228]
MSTYTHGHAEAVLRSHRWRTAANSAAHLLPHLHDGQRLLDVGSGPGTITADLARLVREVVAVEIDEEAAALTRTELERQGVTNATVVVGDVHALDVDGVLGGAFDVVHAHQVLQHVTDPVGALREMLRATRPGGVVAVRDSDYGHFSWHPASGGLDRWLELYEAAARANGGEPHAGRMLLAWAHAAGATDVVAGSSTWCYASPADREWWGGLWADRITSTALARQLVAERRASPEELEQVAAAWRAWATDPDGWFSVLHGEVLVRA